MVWKDRQRCSGRVGACEPSFTDNPPIKGRGPTPPLLRPSAIYRTSFIVMDGTGIHRYSERKMRGWETELYPWGGDTSLAMDVTEIKSCGKSGGTEVFQDVKWVTGLRHGRCCADTRVTCARDTYAYSQTYRWTGQAKKPHTWLWHKTKDRMAAISVVGHFTQSDIQVCPGDKTMTPGRCDPIEVCLSRLICRVLWDLLPV